ncbi:hypothetical protein BH24PSE2_BH24PSE2_13220 [soil metagenome]
MHARIDELLSLRDGEPVDADVAAHVAGCSTCSLEAKRLRALQERLRTLPAVEHPAQAWEAIAARGYRPPARPRAFAAVGLAASIALAIGAVWMLYDERDRSTEAPDATVARNTSDPGSPALMRRSLELENALRVLDDQPRIVRGSTAGTIAEIEDRIALLDHQLSYAAGGPLSDAQSERLWRQRVDLLSSLVQVRYAQQVSQ